MSILLYIGYSYEDTSSLEALKKHLKPLEYQGKIIVYNESMQLGHDLHEVVTKALNEAKIILLLLSANSLSIDSFYNLEIPLAIKQHYMGNATLFPIVLKSCLWKEIAFNTIKKERNKFWSFWGINNKRDFRSIEILPDGDKSIEEYFSHDKAYSIVAERINKHAMELLRQMRMQDEAEAKIKQKGVSVTTYN